MGVRQPIDITAEQRRAILASLNRHLPDTTVWACGSRVKWASRPESDLDLVAFARPEQSARVAELREAFEESSLPFRVDLFVWDETPESFRSRIGGNHVVLTGDNLARKENKRSRWRRCRIEDPAAPVAEAFQNAMQPMLEQIIANVHESRTLAALRDILLPKLIPGGIRLRDAATQVESTT